MQPSHKALVQARMVSDASQLVNGRHGGQDSALRRPSVAIDSEKHHELVCGSQGFVVAVVQRVAQANGCSLPTNDKVMRLTWIYYSFMNIEATFTCAN